MTSRPLPSSLASRRPAARLALAAGLALLAALALGAPRPAAAAPRVTLEPVACLPSGGNAPVRATVDDNVPETEVRVFFRRLSDEVEDFYSLKLEAAGGGRYWGVLPRPADQPLAPHSLTRGAAGSGGGAASGGDSGWAAWWKAKEGSTDRNPTGDLDPEVIRQRASVGRQISRGWMSSMDDPSLERWLDQQTNEPAELYAAVFDQAGTRLALSSTLVAPVRDDCPVSLSEQEAGYAENLVIGETAMWQQDEEPFHWLCDGVVSRRGPFGVLRADDLCRGCIVGERERRER